MFRSLLVLASVFGALTASAAAQHPALLVSVAVSMNDALTEIAALYRAAAGVTVSINTGGSNTLARQIVEGAPATLFLSADEIQMDVVEKAGRIVAGTRTALLSNSLAIVVASGKPGSVTLEQILDGRVNRLAMGEPGAVPAGVYGRTFFERQGAWDRVRARVVPFPTVRAVLSAVQSGRVDAGVVYRSDVIAARVITIADIRDLNIVHSAAVIKGARESDARRFLEFLKSDQARAVFKKRGFEPR